MAAAPQREPIGRRRGVPPLSVQPADAQLPEPPDPRLSRGAAGRRRHPIGRRCLQGGVVLRRRRQRRRRMPPL